MENKERFLSLCRSTNREGMEDLLKWLESSDFFICPASSRYHCSYSGGLLQHSLNVYDEAKRLLTAYPEIRVSEESVIISALLHDLCKVNFYVPEKRNRKNDLGVWESYDTYGISEKFCFGGHGSKSVFLAQQFIKLTAEEGVAINCHMGLNYDGAKDVGKAYERFPLAWLIHVADESATFIIENS